VPAATEPAAPGAGEDPTLRSPAAGAGRRGLDPREIAELELADPPTARLSRAKPPPRPDLHRHEDPPARADGDSDPSPSGEDQLTLRFDRPR
jgi:hypothetical protein